MEFEIQLCEKKTEILDNNNIDIAVYKINSKGQVHNFLYIGEPFSDKESVIDYLKKCKEDFHDKTIGYSDYLNLYGLDNNAFTLYQYKLKNYHGLLGSQVVSLEGKND